MKFKTSREEALDQLNSFIENDILNYNSKRIRLKAYETTEKEFLLIRLLFISFFVGLNRVIFFRIEVLYP